MKKILHIIAILCIISACTPTIRFAKVKNSTQKVKKTKKSSSQNNTEPKLDYKKPESIDLGKLQKRSGLEEYQLIILQKSEEWIGTPYRYGGDSKSGIDCSAFVQNVMKEIGLELPRTAQNQYEFSHLISKSYAEIGDLVFFNNGRKVSHVGIYIGDDMFVHASSSLGVTTSSLKEKWYNEKFYGIGRVKF